MDFLEELKKNIDLADEEDNLINEMLNDTDEDTPINSPVIKKLNDDIFEHEGDKPLYESEIPKKKKKIKKIKKEIQMSKGELDNFANNIIDKYQARMDFKKKLLLKEENDKKQKEHDLLNIRNTSRNNRRNFFNIGNSR